MAIMHVGNIDLVATTQQRTAPSLHIMNSAGEIYYVAALPVDGELGMGREVLVYDATAINTCLSVKLAAGFYRAELRGGAGGLPGGGLLRCRSGSGRVNFNGETISATFKLDAESTVYVFRGGDGNMAQNVPTSQTLGGGASGVDSMVVLPGRVIMAHGGNGASCGGTVTYGGPEAGGGAGAMTVPACNGGGGGFAWSYEGAQLNGLDSFNDTRYGCGGGGGGAPNGHGGAQHATYDFGAGQNSGANGGAGGRAVNHQDTTVHAVGGVGGKTVTWQCGGATAYSYGGGGGGAICFYYHQAECDTYSRHCGDYCFDGGAGGSGSTGTSDVSFVRIYKIG